MAILADYFVGCDVCGDTQLLVNHPVPQTKKEAAAQAKEVYSWKLIDKQWICPRCQGATP